MSRYDPAGTGHNPAASGPKDGIEVAWTHDATDWFLGTAPPIRQGDTIYAVGNGLLALDIKTGTKQFGYRGPYQSTPARAKTSIYDTDTLAATAPSGVYGLNAGGGVEIPLFDESFGVERWIGPQSRGGSFFGPANSVSPVAVGETIYTVIPGTNSLAAVDANDGELRWQSTPEKDESIGADLKRPTVRDGLAVVTHWPKGATAYRTDTGERHWQRELEEQLVMPPVATTKGVVVQSRNNVSLLDATDGSTVWKRRLDANVTESTPAVANGTIFVADELESLHALDLETGETVWTSPFDGPTAPVIADGVVYAVRSGFELVALDAESGETRFKYRPSEVPLSTPIVGDGVLYTTNRERVVALEEAT